MTRLTPADLEAARDRIVPDVVASGLSVLFCGINPGLMTAATGHHFARPGNRFWPVLHLSGFTPRQLAPAEQEELLSYGLGITNVVARATARADELSAQEYRDGARLLTAKVERLRPRWLAVVGVTAYRSAFCLAARPGRPHEDAPTGTVRASLGPLCSQPLALGGEDMDENVQPLRKSCHKLKTQESFGVTSPPL
ncbi:uracil-DNA glycosylase family protein [Streptomyces sp. NPDC059349]|uniref:uracil-DNA glycosylase family protein n=1 Tax=Streptomyces sp. NPDC059349 TaxID=3346808 RepID=UPI0036A051D3